MRLGFADVAIGVYMLVYGWQSVLIHSSVRLNSWLRGGCSPRRNFITGITATIARPATRTSPVRYPCSITFSGRCICRAGRKPTKHGLDQLIPQTYAGAAALSVSQSFHVGAYAAAVTLTRYHLAAGNSVAWEIAWRSREDSNLRPSV